MIIKTQSVDKEQCTLWLQLEHWDTRSNYASWIAIDTSDDILLRMMVDTGLVRKDNTLSIYFDYEWDMMTHIVGYNKIKTIQHNENDYTFIFLN